MKLFYYNLSLEIKLSNDKLNALVVENGNELDKLVLAINKRVVKKGSQIELFEDLDKLEFHKFVDVLYSPIDITFDKKDIQKRLLLDLVEEIESRELIENFIEARTKFIDAIENLKIDSDYNFDIDANIGVDSFLKSFDIRLKEPEGDFSERLIEYMGNVHRLLGKKVFILVACKGYVNQSELKFIKEYAEYQGLKILFIDSNSFSLPEIVEEYIIDSDVCEIY